jgi:hypothetical protein
VARLRRTVVRFSNKYPNLKCELRTKTSAGEEKREVVDVKTFTQNWVTLINAAVPAECAKDFQLVYRVFQRDLLEGNASISELSTRLGFIKAQYKDVDCVAEVPEISSGQTILVRVLMSKEALFWELLLKELENDPNFKKPRRSQLPQVVDYRPNLPSDDEPFASFLERLLTAQAI